MIATLSSRKLEHQAAANGVTITLTMPDGRSVTGTFKEVADFNASTDGVGLYDSRLHAYVLHLLLKLTGYIR